jgi:hypothetical protein
MEMKSGNQWNWTWAFLAIIVGFQSSTLFLYGWLPRPDFDLGAPAFLVGSAMFAHGIPLAISLALCFARRYSAIIGYWNAFLLSFMGVPANITLVIMLGRLMPGKFNFLMAAFVSLVFPVTLLSISVRDLTKKEFLQTSAGDVANRAAPQK